ncbi:MAG: dihydrodipicolinate synthase family protein [Armatimonadetes bacterium]|nr:dihydrodipicolinate synthase family protein [Armatimonadota bacterium]
MPVLPAGCYPAAVTPFDGQGRVDTASLTKLLAYFDAAGCRGVVLAGTNGEGPSLSNYEKRDLIRTAATSKGRLRLILGIATPSLPEAEWLSVQAHKDGADAVLVMPPGYFRQATEDGVAAWFERLLDASPIPVIAYNYPKMTGITLTPGLLSRLAGHPNLAGVKDSSGESANLAAYRSVLSDRHVLFVGDETLLPDALDSGWTGTISGAANVVPRWLARLVDEDATQRGSLIDLVAPVVQVVRAGPQPALNKAVLAALGVIDDAAPRLPLTTVDPAECLAVLERRLGVRPGELGLSPA